MRARNWLRNPEMALLDCGVGKGYLRVEVPTGEEASAAGRNFKLSFVHVDHDRGFVAIIIDPAESLELTATFHQGVEYDGVASHTLSLLDNSSLDSALFIKGAVVSKQSDFFVRS